MKSYLNLIDKILSEPSSSLKPNRTGISTKAISGYNIEHDMREGFPIVTTREIFYKNAFVELEFFIKGLTDKKWLQDRGCRYWDAWANPKKVKYGHTTEIKKAMQEETDLGKIYGYQWRNFNSEVNTNPQADQLKAIVEKLSTDKTDRRMICSAWDPLQLEEMALPPCHLLWQVVVTGANLDTLNLNWYQRSCDVMVGLPYDLILYGLLLELLAKQANLKPGKLCGMLGDVHIYSNHLDKAKKQIYRSPLPLPTLQIANFKNIYEWEHHTTSLKKYVYWSKIKYEVAV